MAKVTVQAIGGALKQIEADTIGEVKAQLNLTAYTATINGEPAGDDDELEDYQFVGLAPAVKGGFALAYLARE